MRLIQSLTMVLLTTMSLSAQINARLFHQPDVSETQIVFAYGGDIWIVPKAGGMATKLSSPKGEESFPRFSPDGSQIAFSGNYDGNTDIYVLPSTGGVPVRVTHHGMSDRMLDWYPDGKSLLYASSMESGKQRFSQFYQVSAAGGLPEKLPVSMGEFGSLSPDGSKIAFTDRSRVFRNWKRYTGGWAPDIWLFDLKTLSSENITNNIASDELPMWVGDKIYFLSDQGSAQRYNIWVYDTRTKASKQVTHFTDFDVHFPSDGPSDIVFEAGGKIQLLDLATEQVREIAIDIVSDQMTLKTHKESVEKYLQNATIAPDGNRVLVEARGDVFSLPAEEGFTQDLTRTPGFAERNPAWSPDGKYIAYWSDKSGEYELTLRDLTSGNIEEQVTHLGPGFRYDLYWSADSKKIAFVDQTMHINVFDLTTKTNNAIDQDPSLFEGGLRGWRCSWSSDGRWMAYSKTMDNGNGAVMIYDTKDKKLTQATSGFYSDLNPTFDREGKYLYLITNRSFNPVYSDFDNTWIYPNATELAVVTLRPEVKSPLAAANDTVAVTKDKKDEKEADKADKEAKDETVTIEFEGFERRIIILPPEAGNMGNLAAADGKIIYMRYPNSGSDGEDSELMFFDLKEKESKTIMKNVNGYELSADGKKLLVRQGRNLGVVGVGSDQKMDKQLALNKMEMTIDPKAEWQQIFNDTWRFERDFFYDKNMHGVDWAAMRKQYGDMIQYAVTRNDVNFILGELIAELNASHTYNGGGDQETPEHKAVGYLGVDWAKDHGQFKIKTIIRGADWDSEVRSPLDEPGVNVKEGEYILAVNGMALADYTDPWAAFEGLSNETVELTVSSTPDWENVRSVVVKTMSDETRLRNLAWIESNRKRVDEESGGKLGYIYVPSTGIDGQNELVRQFYGQWNKQGLVVDERFNNGGQIPDRFIELLNRKPLAYWNVRDGKDWQWPPVGNFGSMVMLINGWSGSGGDAFPDYFRKAGLGPLIGGRTWGGLIGISGAPTLIDGGGVTVPTFRMYNPDGTWFKEGHGVDPDIQVLEDPTQLAKGVDTQLERAIAEALKLVKDKGPIHPAPPQKENRARVIKP
ncbi:MAG: PD40 domain-containing protein [Lewinellaceae bacterium]|nr:PD40 domain-containing protein [Lewinellaceae bacterium]